MRQAEHNLADWNITAKAQIRARGPAGSAPRLARTSTAGLQGLGPEPVHRTVQALGQILDTQRPAGALGGFLAGTRPDWNAPRLRPDLSSPGTRATSEFR
jgi:hypothetical protein